MREVGQGSQWPADAPCLHTRLHRAPRPALARPPTPAAALGEPALLPGARAERDSSGAEPPGGAQDPRKHLRHSWRSRSRAGNAAGGGMGTKQYGGTARSAEGAAGEEEAAAAPPRSQGRISHRLSVEP